MSDEKKGRAVMPATAGLVDELRAVLGPAWVDGALAASQQAKRRHAELVGSIGQAAADQWLARQSFKAGRFWAEEGGRTVGVKVA